SKSGHVFLLCEGFGSFAEVRKDESAGFQQQIDRQSGGRDRVPPGIQGAFASATKKLDRIAKSLEAGPLQDNLFLRHWSFICRRFHFRFGGFPLQVLRLAPTDRGLAEEEKCHDGKPYGLLPERH